MAKSKLVKHFPLYYSYIDWGSMMPSLFRSALPILFCARLLSTPLSLST